MCKNVLGQGAPTKESGRRFLAQGLEFGRWRSASLRVVSFLDIDVVCQLFFWSGILQISASFLSVAALESRELFMEARYANENHPRIRCAIHLRPS